MLAAACVCPHPPLLVPEVAVGAAEEIAELREICLDSVRALVDAAPDVVVCLGAADEPDEWGESAGGSMRPFGVQVAFGGPDQVLPPSLTVAAYLLDESGWTGRRRYVAVPGSAPPHDCADLGSGLVETGNDRVAVLAMGDGSAKRSKTAPGYLDHRAAAFDADAVVALVGGDVEALLEVPPLLADELWAAGRAVWQVLAGVARSTYADGGTIDGTARYDAAPYGVGYWVVDWRVEWPGRPELIER